MPPLEEQNRDQWALLWEAGDVDAYNEPTVSSEAVELEVRWEEKRKQVKAADGTPMNVDATVYVDRAVSIGSRMRKGQLSDMPIVGTGTFFPDGPLFDVVGYDETVDFQGRETLRVVYLCRYKDVN